MIEPLKYHKQVRLSCSSHWKARLLAQILLLPGTALEAKHPQPLSTLLATFGPRDGERKKETTNLSLPSASSYQTVSSNIFPDVELGLKIVPLLIFCGTSLLKKNCIFNNLVFSFRFFIFHLVSCIQSPFLFSQIKKKNTHASLLIF